MSIYYHYQPDPNEEYIRRKEGDIAIDRFIISHPTMRDKHKEIGRALLIFWSIIMICFASQPMAILLHSIRSDLSPSVEGIVTNVEYRMHSSRSGHITYTYNFECDYTVNGQTYHTKLYEQSKEIPEGSPITIHYDESDPSIAYNKAGRMTVLKSIRFGAFVPTAIFVLFVIKTIKYMQDGYVETKAEFDKYMEPYLNKDGHYHTDIESVKPVTFTDYDSTSVSSWDSINR